MNSFVIFATLLATVAGVRENVSAPPGFTYLGSSSPKVGSDGQSAKISQYYISDEAGLWEEAEGGCIAAGLNHLMSINDAAENDLIKVYLSINELYNNWVWTSGSIDSEGNWYWIGSENDMVDYTYWRPGQPTNTATNYHIGVIGDEQTYGWGSVSRGTRGRYVCEVPEEIIV